MDQPQFALQRVTRGWVRAYTKVEAGLNKAQQSSDLDAIDQAYDEQGRLLAQVVEHVPRAWLGEGAPEAIDWSDAAAFEHIRVGKFAELVKALFEAVASGN